MDTSDFKLVLKTPKTPQEVFKCIVNVRDWWSGYYTEAIHGNTEQLQDEFTFFAGEGIHYSKQRIVELIPDKKVVWLITESKLSFLEKTDEWTGTKVIFDIAKTGDETQLTFTHEGLTPQSECYNSCAPVWTEYLQNKLWPQIR